MSRSDSRGPSTVGGHPAVGNVFGFSMLMSKGELLLRLATRALGSGVRLHNYEAAVLGVQLPLAGELTAQTYRQFRCRVRRMTLQIERRAAEGWCCRTLIGRDVAGLRVERVALHLAAHLNPSGDAVPCLTLEGHVQGSPTWVALPLDLSVTEQGLRLACGPAWVLGRHMLAADALAEAVLTRVLPNRAPSDPCLLDPIRGLLAHPFVTAGWKVPDCSQVAVAAVSRQPELLEIRYEPRHSGEGIRAEAIAADAVAPWTRRPGRVDVALQCVRTAQESGDASAVLAALAALADALVHHDEARVAALRWLAEASKEHDPQRCLAALRVWLHVAPHDRTAMRMFIGLAGRHGVGLELARRLTAACRFPNPTRMQVRLELALANVLVDHVKDQAAAQAMIDPLAERLTEGSVDRELATEIWTCVAKAHAEDPQYVAQAVSAGLAAAPRAAQRASVQFAAGRALAQAGFADAAQPLLASAAQLAPDDPTIAGALHPSQSHTAVSDAVSDNDDLGVDDNDNDNEDLGVDDLGEVTFTHGTDATLSVDPPATPTEQGAAARLVAVPDAEPERGPTHMETPSLPGAQPPHPQLPEGRPPPAAPTLAVVAASPDEPGPQPPDTPSDALRRSAWEALETRGDLPRALALLDEGLSEWPTDALLLSALKSIAADDPALYLDALDRAVQASNSPDERDRWALEFAMAAVEIEDITCVGRALEQLSVAAAQAPEAAALRDWVAHNESAQPTPTHAESPMLPLLVTAESGRDDDSTLRALRDLLGAQPELHDEAELLRLAQRISPDRAAVRTLADLTAELPEGDPRRLPLATALLTHAAAIDEAWVAVAALQQSAASHDLRPLLDAWPALQRTILARGEDVAHAQMIETCRATLALAADADELLSGGLVAFPTSASLHGILRHDCAAELAEPDDGEDDGEHDREPSANGPEVEATHDVDETQVDAAVVDRVDALADAHGWDPAQRARLLVGAASCMAGPAAAAVLAQRAEALDWRGPAFFVLVDALQSAGHWPQVMALHEGRATSASTAPERLDARKRLAHICEEVLGDMPAAIGHLEAALQLSPTDPDLLLPLLDHHFGQRDLSRAVQLTARVLDHVRMGHAAFASLAHRAADSAIAMGDPVTAAELLSRVVGRNATDAKAAARLTEIELMAGDPQRRIELLGAVADRQVGRARIEALEERARLLLADERPDAAMDDLATVCRESPARQGCVQRLAGLYREHGRLDALVELHEAQLQRHHGADKIPSLLVLAALYAEHAQDPGRAESALRTGLEHAGPREDDALRAELEDGLAANLRGQGRYADLARWLEDRVAMAPDGGDHALRDSPRRVEALTQLAAVYRDHLGNDDGAATIYRRLEAHAMLPDDGLATLARWYRKERRHEDLVRILVLRSGLLAEAGNDERRSLVERWIAELLEGPLGRPQDAAAHYLEAYLADREDADATGTRARVLLSGTDSIVNVRHRLLQRLETLAPARHPALLVLLADLLAPHEGYESEAEQCYRRALDGDPDLATAHEGLGRLLLRQERSEDAARSLISAVRGDGLTPHRAAEAAALAARALSDQGRSEQAESVLRLALARMPDSQRALLELVSVHDRAGRPGAQAEVLETLSRLPLSGPRHADVAFQRAMLLREEFTHAPRGSQGERARSLLLEAVSADSRHAAARQTLIGLATARQEWSIVAHMYYLTIRELPPGPQRAASHLDLAEVYLDHLGDAPSCMRNIDSALQQASEDIVVATRTTALARRIPDPRTTAEHFERLASGDNELDEAARSRLWLLAADLRMDDAPPSGADSELAELAQRLSPPPGEAAGRSRDRGRDNGGAPSSPQDGGPATDEETLHDLDAAVRLRERLAARGDYDEVVDLSRDLATRTAHQDPQRAAQLLTEAAGFAWHALHQPVRAAELLAEALGLAPTLGTASTSLDELVRTHQASEHAHAMLSTLAPFSTGPTTAPGIALALATLTCATGDEANAVALLRPLIAATPSVPGTPVNTQLSALRLASTMLASRGDRPGQLDVLTRAVALGLAHQPQRVGDTAAELARLHRELGDALLARTTCEDGLQACPEHRGLLQTYAELLEHDGEWTVLAQTHETLAKLALADDEQAMWLTRAARVMLAHPEAAPEPGTARRLLVRACAVAPTRPEPRSTLLPLSFSQSRWHETLELADELEQLCEADDEPQDFVIVAALAQALQSGGQALATRIGPTTDDRVDQWLLPGLRHVLHEVATRGPLPRLDDVLTAGVRMCGGRSVLADTMTRWALRRPLHAGVALGLGRLLEAEGDATQARHHYQLSAFLAPQGAVPGLVARLPVPDGAPVTERELWGGSDVCALLVSLRDAMTGLPWTEAFTPSSPGAGERTLLEQIEVVLEPMRRMLGLPLPLGWVLAGPPLGVGAQACAPVPTILVSPTIAQLPWPERAFRLAAAAADVAMGVAVLAPPGPPLPVLLDALHQHLLPGYEAELDDARTIAEALRIGRAPRDPLGPGRRAALLDELAHHRARPELLTIQLRRRRDILATRLCGRLDGALMACARDMGGPHPRAPHPRATDRTAVVRSDRVQWLLRASVLR